MPKITSYIALLIFINFVSGIAVMVVELTGIRLLAPLFGTSIFTWTALIAVVLIAISIGGLLGGAIADSTHSKFTLYELLMIGSFFTAIIPVLYILFGASIQSLGYISGPTVFSTILFALPAVLLGAISPMVTRMVSLQNSDKHVGFSSGVTNMSGALGSFAGTFLAGFYLIPQFDYRTIFIGTAIVMAICALAYRFTSNTTSFTKKTALPPLLLLLAITLSVFLTPEVPDHIVLTTESPYQRITLITDADEQDNFYLSMYNDNALQGSMYLDNDNSPHPYAQYWDIVKPQLGIVRNALVLGGGAYTYPKVIEKSFPNADIDVVEIDPDVALIADAFYRLDEYKNISTHIDDARYFLSKTENSYDVVIVDVFKGYFGVPTHLTTQQFFQELKSVMRPKAVVLMNIIGGTDEAGARTPHALNNTVSSVFKNTMVFTASQENNNIVGASNYLIMAADTLIAPDDLVNITPEAKTLLETYRPDFSSNDITDGTVFTDFKNLIDQYNLDFLSSISKSETQ